MTTPAPTVAAGGSLEADRLRIEAFLEEILSGPVRTEGSPVQEAMRYSVLEGGQRIRPLLALRLARAMGAQSPCNMRAACAVELLHCASLVVDDLPCMDNAAERRGKPAVHKAYGEATAVLAAFALVAMAARSVLDEEAPAALVPQLLGFQKALLRTLDCSSLIAGQAKDLALTSSSSVAERRRVNDLKTVPLFRLAAMAACVSIDQGSPPAAEAQRFGRDYGAAFQLVDDHLDGDLRDEKPLLAQLDRVRARLAAFGDGAAELQELVDYLHARAFEKDRRPR